MRGKNLHVSARKEHLLLSIATHISCKCEFCGMPVRHDFTLYLERSANIVFLHMIKNSYVVATFVEGECTYVGKVRKKLGPPGERVGMPRRCE